MNREKKIKTLMTGCILIVAAVVVLLVTGGLKSAVGYTYDNANKYTAGETTVSQPVRNLDIGWIDGKVNVVFHSEETIVLTEKAKQNLTEDQTLRWWLDGDTLRVRYAKEGLRLSWNLDKELTITLPESIQFRTVQMDATSADLIIPDLKAEKLDLHSTSGDIKAACTAGEAKVDTTSGGQSLKLSGKASAITVTSTSGGIGLEAESVETLKGSSTSGGIAVSAAGTVGDTNLSTTSGGIAFRCPETDRADIHSTSGGIAVSVGAFRNLKISCTSGGITAALPDTPGFTGELTTTSGSKNTSMALKQDGDRYSCGDGSGKLQISSTSGDIQLLPWEN